jgi:hypothetical protein
MCEQCLHSDKNACAEGRVYHVALDERIIHQSPAQLKKTVLNLSYDLHCQIWILFFKVKQRPIKRTEGICAWNWRVSGN